MKNYSKQREAILNVLRSTNSHPTATFVYEKVREIIPNISLGTVYRNLDALSKSGDIANLSVGDGFEHYDADISHHAHLHCRCCGEILDACIKNDILSDIAIENGFVPESSMYVVNGICKKCSSEKLK